MDVLENVRISCFEKLDFFYVVLLIGLLGQVMISVWLVCVCVCVVHEHEKGKWEACDCGFGFQDVKGEGGGREPEWGRESFLCEGFVSEHWRGGWFWIVSQGEFCFVILIC